MKIQESKCRRLGVMDSPDLTYITTYVNIPKYVQEYMALKDKMEVFLGVVNPKKLRLDKNRIHADDHKVTLNESVTGRYKGNKYTVLRLVIPLRIISLTGIKKGTKAEFSCNGRVAFIDLDVPDT